MQKLKALCFLFITSIVLFSCAPEPTIELGKIDALRNTLDSVPKYLDVDETVLKERIDYINLDLEVVKQYHRDTITLEFGNKMDRYKQIRKIYSSYLSNSDKYRTEYDALSRQLSLLKNSIIDRKISSDSFEHYLEKEAKDVNALLSNAKSKGQFVLTVEPEFTRITKFIEPVIKQIRLKHETVNTLYDGLESD